MKSIYTYILVLIISSATFAQSKGQNNLFKDTNSRYSSYNLNGSVKSLRVNYHSISDKLPTMVKDRIHFDNEIRQPLYVEFDTLGNIMKSTSLSANYDLSSNTNQLDCYYYNIDDIADKICIQIPNRNNTYPIRVENQIIKFDQRNKRVKFENEFIYKYDYHYFGDKIISEQFYRKLVNQEEKDDYLIRAENLSHQTYFEYNELGQICGQKILQGYRKTFPYHAFGTETQICDDTYINYTYDDVGKMLNVELKSCGRIVFVETYIYNKAGSVVKSESIYGGISSYITSKVVFTYNEHGDPIEVNLGNNKPFAGYDPYNRYYDYDYDEQGNWIRCRIFLEGKNASPSAIAERTIEYYQ